MLNDCKYGISLNGNEMQLTLLRAAATPEMRADNGEHEFTYAFTAWEGQLSWPRHGNTYDTPAMPMQVAVGATAAAFSAFAVDHPNVFIDTVKPAEDGSGDVILRMYEAKKADTTCALSVNVPAGKVWACDLLENKLEELPVEEGCVMLHFHTFEVKTLRIEC